MCSTYTSKSKLLIRKVVNEVTFGDRLGRSLAETEYIKDHNCERGCHSWSCKGFKKGHRHDHVIVQRRVDELSEISGKDHGETEHIFMEWQPLVTFLAPT